jgi:hypothetical protein
MTWHRLNPPSSGRVARQNGTIHVVMLNALRDTHASKAATAQGGEFLRATLWDE